AGRRLLGGGFLLVALHLVALHLLDLRDLGLRLDLGGRLGLELGRVDLLGLWLSSSRGGPDGVVRVLPVDDGVDGCALGGTLDTGGRGRLLAPVPPAARAAPRALLHSRRIAVLVLVLELTAGNVDDGAGWLGL